VWWAQLCGWLRVRHRCAHRLASIVDAMSIDDKAVVARLEWERYQAAIVSDSHERYLRDLARRDRLEARADQLREELGVRLAKLMEDLEPYVDGTMGEVTAAMAGVYLKAAHELAGLHGLTRTGRAVTVPLPLPEPPVVPDVLEAERVRAVGVAESRDAARRQLVEVRRRMLGG